MFRMTDKINITIDGISIEVPDKILSVLPTVSGMKDALTYETGREVTYETLEPLVTDLLFGYDANISKRVDEHPEDWEYYLVFLDKYVDPDVAAKLLQDRRKKVEDMIVNLQKLKETHAYKIHLCRLFGKYNKNKLFGLRSNTDTIRFNVDGTVDHIPFDNNMAAELIEAYILYKSGEHPIQSCPGAVVPSKIEMDIFGLSL